MPGIKPGPVGWHTSALTNEIQEVSSNILGMLQRMGYSLVLVGIMIIHNTLKTKHH
jgi:hypothetical protein